MTHPVTSRVVRSTPNLQACLSLLFTMSLCSHTLHSQTAPAADVATTMQQLTDSITRVQEQINHSQQQLNDLRKQLSDLQQATATPAPAQAARTESTATTADLRERQDMQESQLATLQQIKVESASKYPVTITGMLLFNGFVNSTKVDMAATPTAALFGRGSLGASMRQTLLGVDARGPRLLRSHSYADLRVDFDGDPAGSSDTYPGSYSHNATIVRLRTAHAGLDWKHTSTFFALDRPILSPDTPTSLTAVAEPPLAWSGNLWAWNPQIGLLQELPLSSGTRLGLQVAMIDPSDAPATLAYRTTTTTGTATTAQQSKRPGGEARVALMGLKRNDGPHFGIGGYFAPHLSTSGNSFNAWAATLDARFPLAPHLEFTASSYRGQALGGLGAGEYKDYLAGTVAGLKYFRALDNVGGWTQLKQQVSERLQFNEAFGLDQIFARQVRGLIGASSTEYLNFARNRTITGNVIYSPSAYLLFSFEYRRLETAPVAGRLWTSNIYGAAAAYRF